MLVGQQDARVVSTVRSDVYDRSGDPWNSRCLFFSYNVVLWLAVRHLCVSETISNDDLLSM